MDPCQLEWGVAVYAREGEPGTRATMTNYSYPADPGVPAGTEFGPVVAADDSGVRWHIGRAVVTHVSTDLIRGEPGETRWGYWTEAESLTPPVPEEVATLRRRVAELEAELAARKPR